MLYSCHGHIEISQKIPRWQAREWIDMAKVFKFTATKATEKIQLTVEITKEDLLFPFVATACLRSLKKSIIASLCRMKVEVLIFDNLNGRADHLKS